jgi:3'-phosphoadenosine 5'-phosphosulfate (PAPS) 3'-phosphatase
MPGVPVISEEASAQSAAAATAGDVVLVDPVDGTRELVGSR